jgi:hypothetical protein
MDKKLLGCFLCRGRFLCSAHVDAFDFYARELTTMANRAVISFAPLKLKRDYLFVFALLNHFAGDFSAGNQRITVCEVIAVGVEQDIAKGSGLASFDIKKIDIDSVAFADAVLSATCFNNCVSHEKEGMLWGKKPRKVP